MSSVQEETQSPTSLAATGVNEEASQSEAGRELEQAESGNIDKIREIIFGGQMRDYEKRFALLESRLIKESAELREDTRKRFEVLEMFIKREFEALSDRLQTEGRYREESVQGLSRVLHDASQALEAKLVHIDGSSARAQRDLREQILEQSKTLSDEIRQRHEDMTSALGHEVAELNRDKTGRADLASLFSELALRLNGDFRIPGDD
ncbi:MAG: hypothetical protein ACREA9_09395 [Pyrinomonadaceae bacterium]